MCFFLVVSHNGTFKQLATNCAMLPNVDLLCFWGSKCFSWSALHKNNQFKQNYMIFCSIFCKTTWKSTWNKIEVSCLVDSRQNFTKSFSRILYWYPLGWSETDEIFEKFKKSKSSNNFETASQHWLRNSFRNDSST